VSDCADPRARFGPVAARYQRARPSYPSALVDWVLAQAGLRSPLPRHGGEGQGEGVGAALSTSGQPSPYPSPAGAGEGSARAARIADVGCGTGIATRLFAARGLAVVGVDPSEGMLAEARAAGGGATYVRGEAAATTLAGASIDLVIVAQALHWFDLDAALAEFARILRPGGACAAFWNERARSAFEDDYEPLLLRFSREYKGRGHAMPVLAGLRASPRVQDLREERFTYHQDLDREALLDRVRSSSYVAHGVEDHAGFDAAVSALFERHQQGGRVRLDYDTLAVAWRLRC
jgi:ubiquinone/menaquinone biosynthesis C-methylase UbiE